MFEQEKFAWDWMRGAEIGAVVLHSNPLMCPHVQWSQHGHKNALNQVCLPNTPGHRDLWKTRLCLPSPSPDPHVPEAHSGTGKPGKSWGQLQHSYGGYCLPDVTVNRTQLSVLMAKDCRLLAMHLVLGTLGQSLRGDTEGTDLCENTGKVF